MLSLVKSTVNHVGKFANGFLVPSRNALGDEAVACTGFVASQRKARCIVESFKTAMARMGLGRTVCTAYGLPLCGSFLLVP